jgi:hypothetical protein
MCFSERKIFLKSFHNKYIDFVTMENCKTGITSFEGMMIPNYPKAR